MPLDMTDADLNAIIAEVGNDLENVVAAASARLNKADEESASASPAGSASPEGSSSPAGSPGGDGGSASAGGPPMDGGGDASAGGPPMGDPASAAPAPDASAAPGAGGAPAEEDLETKLQGLPDDQLRHLYMATKQALFARMASADPSASASAPAAPPAAGGSPAGAPPAPAASPSPSPAAPPMAASPSPSPSAQPPMPPPAMKGEMKASPANGGGKTSAIKVGKADPTKDNLMKSEDAQKIDTLAKQVENLSKALEGTLQFLTQPMRKAITGISQIQHVQKPGSEPEAKAAVSLSKTEITEKLKSLDLKKTTPKDRKLINDFYCNQIGVDKIAHLLQ